MANEFKVRKGLVVNGSGSVILDVQGSQGQLFSVTDQLSGSLFSVNDISGVPVLEAFSDSTVKIGQYLSEAIIVSGSTARITGSIAMAGFSSGSVLFAGPGGSISQNNASFFWDNVNGRLGINNSTPAERLDVNGVIRAWTSVQLGQFGSGVLNASSFSKSATGADFFSFDNASGYNAIAGTYYFLRLNNNIAPTTGSAVVNQFLIQGTINQTGGANGITRGIYVNPTVTAAANFRSIEWSTNAATSPSQSWGLYGLGSAPNYLSGSLSIGPATNEGLSFQYSQDNTLGGSFASRIVSLASGVAYRDLFLVSRAVLFQQQGYINSLYISPNGNTVLNSLTDDGVNKLQVSGSARITDGLVVTGSATITSNLTAIGGNVSLASVGGSVTFINGYNNQIIANRIHLYSTPTNIRGINAGNQGWILSKFTGASDLYPSSIFAIDSTTQGFLVPRMSVTQRTAITNPNQGLLVYDTSSATEGLWMYNSGSTPGWQEVLTNSGSQSISGSLTATSFTGSLFGTASYAINGGVTQIVAGTNITISPVDGKGVVTINSSGGGGGGSSFPYTGSAIITGSLIVTGSIISTLGFTGSLFGTSSWAENVVSSSYAYTASYVNPLNQTVVITGSLNISGSTTQIGGNNLLGNTRLSGSIVISGSLGTNNPTVQIYGDTTHNGYIRFDPVSTNIDASVSASYIYVSGSTNDLYFTQNGDGFGNTTRLRWLEGNVYTGILTGGVVSGSVGGTTFSVSSGSGIIVTLNATTASREPYPTINYIKWPSFTNVTPTYLNTYDTTWLLIDANGSLIQQASAPNNGEYDSMIQIGSVVHPNLSTISLFKTFTITSYGIAQQTYEFIRAFGGIKISGHTMSASGSSLSLNRSSGVAYSLGRNYVNNASKPSYVTDVQYNAPNVFRYYKSGSVFVTTTGTTVLDPANYNTPTTSTGLSSVPGGLYTIQRVFYFPNQPNTIGVYYGRDTYNSIANALANLPYETFEENNNTATQAIFLGYVIVKSGTSNLSNTTDAKIIQAGAFRNTTGGGGGTSVATSLNDLSDVAIASETLGDLLVYNGAEWQNTKTVPSITGSFTGSFTGTLIGNATTALTASSADNFTVRGTLTAQTIVAQTVTSSILYSSGSNIFGNSLSNTQDFTGSVRITGSLSVNGGLVPLGSGAAGQVSFWTGSSLVTGSNNFLWDSAATQLTLGTTTVNPIINLAASANASTTNVVINNAPFGGTLLTFRNPADTRYVRISGVNFDIVNSGNISAGQSLIAGSINITGTTVSGFNNSSLNLNGDTVTLSSRDNTSATIILLAGNGEISFRQRPASVTTTRAIFAQSTGNFIIQNGGTFTDTGERLQVSGSSRFAGNMVITGSANITQALTASVALISGSGTQRLTVVGSGSAQPLFTVQGSQGELFSIVDSLSGSLFSVNDQSGLPIMEVFSDNTILMGNYLDPMLLTTARTSSAAGINTLYTLPTSSYDAVYIDYTIRSGSNARAGNFMAMWSGTSVNFTDNSITEFGTTSGFVFGAHISGSNMVVTGSSSTSGWTVKTIIKAI